MKKNIIIKKRELKLYEHTPKHEIWVSWAPNRSVSKFSENNFNEQQLGGGACLPAGRSREGEPEVPPHAKNIILTGMRGSGKSTLGKLIAAKLNREFIDLDSHIERLANKKIAQLVEEHGWSHFRNLESQATEEISQRDNLVIATGGGTFLDKKNAQKLKKNGIVLLLTADTKTLTQRIKFDSNRPPLTDKKTLEAELEQLWEERKDIYIKNADLIYDNSHDLDPTSKIDEIIEMLPMG